MKPEKIFDIAGNLFLGPISEWAERATRNYNYLARIILVLLVTIPTCLLLTVAAFTMVIIYLTHVLFCGIIRV